MKSNQCINSNAYRSLPFLFEGQISPSFVITCRLIYEQHKNV